MKVIIIGGGVGGLTLARACLDAGMAVELYEKRSLSDMFSGPGGIFIQRNAVRVYKLLDGGRIHDRLYQQGGTILEGGFFSKRGDPLYISTPGLADTGERDLGVCLLRPELQQILYDALPAGTVRTERAFERYEEISGGIQVWFRDGSSTTGHVLVGADGLYSTVRARMQGKERLEAPAYSGMTCWRGYFDANGVQLDPRYSWWEYWGRGDRFGYFHVGGKRYSFYAFDNAPPGGSDATEGGAQQALRNRFGGYCQPVRGILELLGQHPIYRDDIYDRPPPGRKWGRGRVALIGDAAHPIQPNLGQGGCIAIEDAFELARRLARHGEHPIVPRVLRAFEAGRTERVTRMFNVSRQVGRLGQTEGALACTMRDWLYRLTPIRLADQQFRWLFAYKPAW